MSDFDAVLERLLGDPAFKAALAADPDTALAGYRLTPAETELLHAQVSMDAGGDHRVEARTSKASLLGMLTPLAGVAGMIGLGRVVEQVGLGPTAHAGLDGVTEGFGPAADDGLGDGLGIAPGGGLEEVHTGFGVAEPGFDQVQTGFGGAETGFGTAPAGFSEGLGGPGAAGFGTGPSGAGTLMGQHLPGLDQAGGIGQPLPPDYHPNVDVDGDGHWDAYTARVRPDGGIDISADMDGDGRYDFVGHDVNRDGLIDAADYDEDGDGRLETHMSDIDGDGWMDRRVVDAASPGEGIGLAGGTEGLGPPKR